jgi:hypothetical protein
MKQPDLVVRPQVPTCSIQAGLSLAGADWQCHRSALEKIGLMSTLMIWLGERLFFVMHIARKMHAIAKSPMWI